MLTQNYYRGGVEKRKGDLNRGDAETRRRGRARGRNLTGISRYFVRAFFLSLCLFVSVVVISSCSSKPVDLRALVPADTLIYLETNDLGKTVAAITENKKFQELAKNKPDTSVLKGIQLAVAVTGFETSEKAEGENTVLDLKPRFAAIAETHAWNYQALSFTENKLGEFINEAYGGEVLLDTVEKDGGRWFTWTAGDGRKAFAFVQSGRVYFGNDEAAIAKCLAISRGEGESLAGRVPLPEPAENTVAAGFISQDGVAQVANLAAIGMARRAGEDEDVQKFIAGFLPQFLRGTMRDLTWTATKTETGIEDRITISADPETGAVWKETLAVSEGKPEDLAQILPADVTSVTKYDLKDPQMAWRGVLLTAAKRVEEGTGKMFLAFANLFFEPYGVDDGEAFLSAVGPGIVTAKFDAEGEKAVAIVTVKDAAKIKGALAKEIDLAKPAEKIGNADVWRSADGDVAVAFFDNKLITGDAESVIKCLEGAQKFTGNTLYSRFTESKAAAVTVGRDNESAGKIVDVVSVRKSEEDNLPLVYMTETRFTEKKIERITISDFGFLGSIIEQLE